MANPILLALIGSQDSAQGMDRVAEEFWEVVAPLIGLDRKERNARLGSWISEARRQRDNVVLVGTGEGWGGAIQSLERNARLLVREATSSLHMTVYSITSGATGLLEDLEAALRSSPSLHVHMLINRPAEQNPELMGRLKALASERRHRFHLKGITPEKGDLHAKIIVSDRHRVLLGSANLSFHGFNVSRELAVLIDGPVSWGLADMVERLMSDSESTEIPDGL